jgi:hypothetical protein
MAGPSAKSVATLAMLKSNFDAGHDHLEMFIPFVLDGVSSLPRPDFTTSDLQQVIEERHTLLVPLPTLNTLLGRVKKKKLITSEGGRYFRQTKAPKLDLGSRREEVEAEQAKVGRALAAHAAGRGTIWSENEAMASLLRFLDRHQIAILLEEVEGDLDPSPKEDRIVASFIQQQLSAENELSNQIRGLVEGLVLRNTMFLADLNSLRMKFRDLRTFFDTGFLLKLLGYEGRASKNLAADVVDMLSKAGATCGVFKRTLEEVGRILAVYRDRLGTATGLNGRGHR